MFSGTDNILHNITHIKSECGNIMWNIVSFREHCYGYEECCAYTTQYISDMIIVVLGLGTTTLWPNSCLVSHVEG